MLQIRRCLDFREETFGANDRGQLRLQDLERHLALVFDVVRQVHRAAGAGAGDSPPRSEPSRARGDIALHGESDAHGYHRGVKTELGFEARLAGPFERAVDEVSAALKARGFGILTKIDLRSAFAEKLGVDFREYVILGACNPALAHRAVSSHPEVGLLLPCNVTVEAAADGSVVVRITDPQTLFSAGGFEPDSDMAMVAGEARRLLKDVATSLSAASGLE